jgi:hypothetical protein
LLQFYHVSECAEVSDPVHQIERHFQQTCGAVLTSIADCLEQQWAHGKCESQLRPDLEKLLSSAIAEGNPIFSSHEQTLLGLSRNIASLLDQLEEDVYSVPLFTATIGWSPAEHRRRLN